MNENENTTTRNNNSNHGSVMLWVDPMIIPASASWMKCLSAGVDLITSFSLGKAFTFIDKKIMSLKCPHL